MTLLLSAILKTSVLLVFAFAVTALLRRRSAAWRHWVWAITVVCAAASPLLTLAVPSWHVPAATVFPASAVEFRPPSIAGTLAARPAEERGATGIAPEQPAVTRMALAVWAIGSAGMLFVLVAGLGRLWWISSRARRVQSGIWVEVLEALSHEYGLRRRIVLCETDHPHLLVTWGTWRPEVLIPAAARGWPSERVRVVLSHEIAHVARGDWIVQIAADLLRCVYWFNPLVWGACRRIRLEAEQAADEAVLRSGLAGVEYAGHLVDVARVLSNDGRGWLPAPAIARVSSLERRVHAMLNSNIDRSPMSRRSRVALAAVLTAAAATLAAAQGPFATFSGSIADPMNGTLANATLRLTNAQNGSRYEVRSDQAGRFEFVGLPPGDYALEASFRGFATLKGVLSVSGADVRRDLTLKVGSLEETMTVHAAAHGGTSPSTHAQLHATTLDVRPTVSDCTPSATGGTLRQPAKLNNVRPVYPELLQSSGIGGVVVLEGIIGTDGLMHDVHVVTAAHPDLDAAAMEAVHEWRFSETLLNCVPVEVSLTLTVRFLAE